MNGQLRFTVREALDTPYKRARQEWDERMGNAVIQARNWRLATFVTLFALIFAIAGLAYVGSKPKSLPYVVEIDKLGAATFRGELGQQLRDFKPSDVQVKYHLNRFVHGVRTVSSDAKVTKQFWTEAFAMCTERCGRMLTTYVAGAGNPVKRAEIETVHIEIVAEVQVSAGTWQVDWREKSWDLNGNFNHEVVWRGMFHVQLRPPTGVEDLRQNPIGLYIDEFHWDRVGG
jgi:type IV secretory pathway TrbF-like protein